jgi:peptidoglycan/LPS O-acetylase OafA/YrhL
LLARSVDARPNRYVAALAMRPLARIGYDSYSIYLWHGWVCSLLPQATLVSMLGCILAAVLLGALIGMVIEYPRSRFAIACSLRPCPGEIGRITFDSASPQKPAISLP